MNWKFWQKKPKTEIFGPVIKWPTDGLATQQEEAKPTGTDSEPVEVEKPAGPEDPDMMDPEIKARWVAELRSGKYKQGTGNLKYRKDHDKSEYCCLGVLCEIAVQDGIIDPGKRHPAWGIYDYDDAFKVPSTKVVEWAGLPEHNPTVDAYGDRFSLGVLNDGGDHDFNKIADLIEAQL